MNGCSKHSAHVRGGHLGMTSYYLSVPVCNREREKKMAIEESNHSHCSSTLIQIILLDFSFIEDIIL